MSETYASVPDFLGAELQVAVRKVGGSGPSIQILEHKVTSPYVNLDLDETGVVVLGSHALLHNWEVFNLSADVLFVKLYNKATAPTSSDTPLKVWVVYPGNAPFQGEVVSAHDFPLGLGLRCTKGLAHNDVQAPATNACVINLGYRAG